MRDFDYTMRTKRAEKGTTLDGYVPSDAEKESNRQPEQVKSASNLFGTIAAGKSSKGENIFVLSQKKSQKQNSLSPNERSLNEQTKTELPDNQKGMFQNLHDKNESAIEYRNKENKAAIFVRNSLQRAFDNNDFEMQEDVLPFTKIKAHKKQLENLREERRLAGKNHVELDRAIEELSNQIIREEQHYVRFRRQLEEMNSELNQYKYEEDDIIRAFTEALEQVEEDDDDSDDDDDNTDDDASEEE